MRTPIYVFFALVFLFSCGQDKKEEEALFKEVMDIHDIAMPEMGTLRKISKQLTIRIDSLTADSLAIDSTQVAEILTTVGELKKANESMMEWMRQFKQLEEGTPHGEVMNYLKEQKKSIEKVRDDMNNAKKQGEYYLEE